MFQTAFMGLAQHDGSSSADCALKTKAAVRSHDAAQVGTAKSTSESLHIKLGICFCLLWIQKPFTEAGETDLPLKARLITGDPRNHSLLPTILNTHTIIQFHMGS